MDRGARARERRLSLAVERFRDEAFIQSRAREELLRRLEPVQIKPTHILDIGGGPGLSARALADRYRKATVTLVDSSPSMLRAASKARGWWRGFDCVPADAAALPVADCSVDLVFAGFLLPYLADPAAFFAQVRRVLKPRGYFVFSTVGAPTLSELRMAFSKVDAVPHVADFPDFHDVGDALTRAGFVAPVLDADRLTVTYASLADLCRDLRAAGAGSSFQGRSTLTGRHRWQAANSAFEALRNDEGRIPVTCELVYGQAWCPDGDSNRQSANSGEVVVPLSQLKRR